MLRLEGIVCCFRSRYEDKEHYLASNETHHYHDGFDDDDDALTLEPMPEEKKTAHYLHWMEPTPFVSPCSAAIHLQQSHGYRDTLLQGKFCVLKDWATALRACHANGIVHGNLTPESLTVDVARGTGILLEPPHHGSLYQWTGSSPDNDLYNVRWAATELFSVDENNLPTTMSDVYSFGCLMLQMLTGTVPYCGTKRVEQVVYLKYLGREPIDAQTPKVADRYITFMRRCWSLKPEKRPTMDTVVDFIHDEMKRLESQRDHNFDADQSLESLRA